MHREESIDTRQFHPMTVLSDSERRSNAPSPDLNVNVALPWSLFPHSRPSYCEFILLPAGVPSPDLPPPAARMPAPPPTSESAGDGVFGTSSRSYAREY
jgi:hypothetical protein